MIKRFPWVLPCVFGLYCLVTAVGRSWHEPWRDEADAWLMARDASVAEIVSIAPHAGTPPLWYLVQMPFAKAGFPYETQGVLCLIFMWASAYLILFRSPFPWWIRIALLGSYFFLFEYSVLARNYSLGTLLLIWLAVSDSTRHSRPWRYAVGLALLAETSAHFLFVSAALTTSYVLESGSRRYRKARLRPAVLAIAGIVLCLIILWPRPGGQFGGSVLGGFNAQGPWAALRDLGQPTHEWRRGTNWWPPFLGCALVLSVLLGLRFEGRAFRMAVLGILGLTYVYGCKYYSAPRHVGPLFVLLIYCLWISLLEKKKASRAWLKWRSRPAFAALLVVCLVSGFSAVSMLAQERVEEFSAAPKAARFLTESGLWKRTLVAHRPAQTSPILAGLPGRKQFYYPALQSWGSHMKWDRAYWESYWADRPRLYQHVKEKFPDWNDPDKGPVLILNYALENESAVGYRLVFKTESRVWGYSDEQYWIYLPASGATDRQVATPK